MPPRQYCGWACGSLYKGFWLTFSDNQGAFPSDPQGQLHAFNPTFYETRVVFRDSGGNIFVQPDVAEAPFTSSYQGWITHGDGYFLSRAEVSPANDQIAIDWIRDDGATGITVARGHAKAKRAGTVKIRLKPTKAAKRAASECARWC